MGRVLLEVRSNTAAPGGESSRELEPRTGNRFQGTVSSTRSPVNGDSIRVGRTFSGVKVEETYGRGRSRRCWSRLKEIGKS